MTSSATIARPYAKAAFEFALESGKLEKWSRFLECLGEIAKSPAAQDMLINPNITPEQVGEILSYLCRKTLTPSTENFLQLLIQNGRVAHADQIAHLFKAMREQYEKRVSVDIVTALPLSRGHKKQFTKLLSERLQREVELTCSEDASLLGGAVIRAGDMVIDGSVRGALHRLSETLECEG